MAFRGHYEHNLDAKDRLTVPARFRAALADGVVLSAGLDPCVEVYPPATSRPSRALAELNPLSRHGRKMKRRFHGGSYDETLDSAGRVRIPRHLIEHARLCGACVLMGWSTTSRSGAPGAGRTTTPRARRPSSRRGGVRHVGSAPRGAAEVRVPIRGTATLTCMPTEHVPVLAAELIGLLDPRPGETAIECTFGAAATPAWSPTDWGQRELSSASIAPCGERAVRGPRGQPPCQTRFMRATFAEALAELRAEGAKVLTWSTWTWASRTSTTMPRSLASVETVPRASQDAGWIRDAADLSDAEIRPTSSARKTGPPRAHP